jgi:alanine racemase
MISPGPVYYAPLRPNVNPDETRRAWVEVNLSALRRNATALLRRAGVPLLPMVKSDAYGLGAVEVARTLAELEPWGFGVATVDEGRQLRNAGITARLIVFTPLLSEEFSAVRELDLIPAHGSVEAVTAWLRSGGGTWHLAIDTGMNRSGLSWDSVSDAAEVIRQCPPEGAFTHFHSADRNDGSLELQQRRFMHAVNELPERPRYLHAENSPSIERQSPSPWDLCRPGVFLYGVGGQVGSAMIPESVARLRARVVELRDVPNGETVSYEATWRAVGPRRIATVAAGYADGVRRALSNRGFALVGGRRAPIAGVVTMDMTMLDVTEVACEVGDVATFIGQDGDDELSVNDVARIAELSPYELLVGLRLRAPRVYTSA